MVTRTQAENAMFDITQVIGALDELTRVSGEPTIIVDGKPVLEYCSPLLSLVEDFIDGVHSIGDN